MLGSKLERLEILICGILFLLVAGLSAWQQQPITLNQGQGWDGIHYVRLAEQFHRGLPLTGEAPFIYRIGAPILASLVNGRDLLVGFKTVTFAVNALTLIAFVTWNRQFVRDWRVRVLLAALLLTHWLSPFRMVHYCPVTSDSTFFTILLLGLLCIAKSPARPVFWSLMLSVVVFIGVFFRESALLLAVVALFTTNPFPLGESRRGNASADAQSLSRLAKLARFLPILAGTIGLAQVHRLATPINKYSFFDVGLYWLYQKPWPTYFHALFVVFGPMLILPIFNWRRSWTFLARHQALLVFLVGTAVVAYVGGSDTERFWYWAIPVVFILIGRAIQDTADLLRNVALVGVLAATQAVAQRVFWTLPDVPSASPSPSPLLTVPSSSFQYLDLYSFFEERMHQARAAAEYVVLSLALLLWLHHRAKRLNRRNAVLPQHREDAASRV